MKKIITLLLVTVLFVNCMPIQTKANTVIDLEEMSQYDGYLEAVYEAYVTNSAYIASKYTDNLGYIDGIIGQLKQNARAFYKELKNQECVDSSNCNWATEFYKKLIAGASTAVDFIKDYFADEEQYYDGRDDDFYLQYLRFASTDTIVPLVGYEFLVKDASGNVRLGSLIQAWNDDTLAQIRLDNALISSNNVSYEQTWRIALGAPNTYSPSAYIRAANKLGVVIGIRESGRAEEITAEPDVDYQTINNYIQNNSNLTNPGYQPQVNAQLVCPSATSSLDMVGGALMLNDYPLSVDKNTSQTVFNGENCLVNFIPTPPQITGDGQILVVNSEGERLDLLTNLPVSPSDDYDYSLIEYVSNSYNYATSLLSSGVNGLRSIIVGTAGLVSFTGSLFGFLPPELLTLFIGGFSIALGLWVFKK